MNQKEITWEIFMEQSKKDKRFFSTFNIMGKMVLVERHKVAERVWFTAYSELIGSRCLKDDFIGYPTFRKGDIIGIDTAHSFNEKQSQVIKLANALHQMESIIEIYDTAVREDL